MPRPNSNVLLLPPVEVRRSINRSLSSTLQNLHSFPFPISHFPSHANAVRDACGAVFDLPASARIPRAAAAWPHRAAGPTCLRRATRVHDSTYVHDLDVRTVQRDRRSRIRATARCLSLEPKSLTNDKLRVTKGYPFAIQHSSFVIDTAFDTRRADMPSARDPRTPHVAPRTSHPARRTPHVALPTAAGVISGPRHDSASPLRSRRSKYGEVSTAH